jgi:hypothetical protein
MSLDIWVHTCLADVETVRDAAVLHPFLRILTDQGEGFFLSDFEAEQGFGDWYDALISLDPNAKDNLAPERLREVTTAGLSATLRASLDRFTRRERDSLIIAAYSVASKGALRGMHYLLTILTQDVDVDADGTESIRVRALQLDAGEDALNSEEKEDLLYALPLRLYEAWRPLMVYLAYGDSPITTNEDAAAGRIRYLYAVNVYSPAVVQRLGRQRLLATPGANVETRADGGMLLRPNDMKAAAVYLGLNWTFM